MEDVMSRALAVGLLGFALGCQVPPPSSSSGAAAANPAIGVARQALLSQPGDGPNGAHIIYLNFDGNGGTLYPMDSWPEDSATNKSQILYSGTNATIPMPKFDPSPYAGQFTAQQAIDTITSDFKGFYAPFNVQIVTSRPTSGRYTMCVIGGFPQDVLGSGSGARPASRRRSRSSRSPSPPGRRRRTPSVSSTRSTTWTSCTRSSTTGRAASARRRRCR
jgi:hypothetical protein